MTRMIILADSEQEVDFLPVSAVHRANVIVVRGKGVWRVVKSPGGPLDQPFETELDALKEAL